MNILIGWITYLVPQIQTLALTQPIFFWWALLTGLFLIYWPVRLMFNREKNWLILGLLMGFAWPPFLMMFLMSLMPPDNGPAYYD